MTRQQQDQEEGIISTRSPRKRQNDKERQAQAARKIHNNQRHFWPSMAVLRLQPLVAALLLCVGGLVRNAGNAKSMLLDMASSFAVFDVVSKTNQTYSTSGLQDNYRDMLPYLDYKTLYANSSWQKESRATCTNLPATVVNHRPRNLTDRRSVRAFFDEGWKEFDKYLAIDPVESRTASENHTNLEKLHAVNQTKLAPCYFRFRKWRSHHFPHAMESIYRCISFWQSYPDLQPVLVHDADLDHFPPSHLTTQQSKIDYYRNSPNVSRPLFFFEGMLLALMEVFHVQFIEHDQSIPALTPRFPRNMHQQGFDLHDSDVLRVFRNGLASHYNGKDDSAYGRHRDIESTSCNAVPRIAMLTREMTARGRKILNEEAVAKAISEHLRKRYSLQQDGDIPLVQFFNTSFLDQVSFFSSVDIVVAGHGAQNTGIGFMPQCGGVFDLFPQGIQFPNYFGTLAHDAGLEYMLYYVSDADMQTDRDRGHNFNKALSSNDMCPQPEDLFEGIDKMITSWQSCCERLSSPIATGRMK